MTDRNTAQPMYKIIAGEILQNIAKGEINKGALFMSEAEMQRKYGVSRVTVRKAYKQLIDQGVLKTVQGKGTYVTDIDSNDWTWMSHFTEEVKAAGHVPSTRMVFMKTIEADEKLAERLSISVGTSCYYFKRIRCVDNHPMWLTESYLPCAVAPGLNVGYFSVYGVAQSLFKVLELNYNLLFTGGEEQQEATIIKGEDALLMEIKGEKPIIRASFLVYGYDGKGLVFEKTIFRQGLKRDSKSLPLGILDYRDDY